VGEAGMVVAAVAGINALKPDVVLLDVHLPDGGGPAVLAGIAAGPVCLALSVSDSAEDVIAAIRAGARGYVTKVISGVELATAVRRVAGGDARLERVAQDTAVQPQRAHPVGLSSQDRLNAHSP
jgi:DNA-binding NarL/FixJ family response regulator